MPVPKVRVCALKISAALRILRVPAERDGIANA